MSERKFDLRQFRLNRLSRPLMGWYSGLLPDISDTERQAIEAGSVWWDRELVSGKPDWDYLRKLKIAPFTDEEQAFLDNEVATLCAMLDDWEIEHRRRDLPDKVWHYLIENGFFAMIIPAEYGGKGFSARAHSEVVRTIASRSTTAAVTVMVPNSLGPGELLLLYGTDDQKDYYLPRLARGEEIPCFALTGIEAGSDASAMTDVGVVCEREYEGRTTLGISIDCDKRYITLAPISTLAGLAVKLRDPDRLLGGDEDLGITVVLMPTDTPGLEVGRRHWPSGLAFQNGPVRGQGAFVPIEQILGGPDQIGQGWKMLMGALAAGRGISLPSLSASGCAYAAHTTGAYARIREQFGRPIGEFEGIREPLARIASTAYMLDGARQLTTAGIDLGEKPAVISAIMKYHATERLRTAINDAMDIHGGKAICIGPRNYLDTSYRALPVGITVEGANILTRSLIVFGQGSIRCHPYLLDEMKAVEDPDKEAGLAAFDRAIWGHIGYQLASAGRSFWHGLTGAVFAAKPRKSGKVGRHYRALSRASAQLAISSELALATLGGALKRKEALSARIGDVLAECYLLCGALKRFETEGCPREDRALLDHAFADGLYRIQESLREAIRRFPNPLVKALLWVLVFPLGAHRRPPSDRQMHAAAQVLLEPGATRDRIGRGLYIGTGDDPLALLEDAFMQVQRRDALLERLKEAGVDGVETAMAKGLLTRDEAAEIEAADAAVRRVLDVDDFDPQRLTGEQPSSTPKPDRQHVA